MFENNRKTNVLAVFIWLYIWTNTTLYIDKFSTHYFVEVIALVGMLVIFVLSMKSRCVIRFHKVILLYLLSTVCLIIPDFVSYNAEGLKMGINMLIPVYMLFILVVVSRLKGMSNLLVFLPMIYGFIISVQSLILWFLTASGVEVQGKFKVVEKNNGQQRYVFDYLLGLRSTIFNINGHKFLRLNGYYLEPAKFAFFLIIPVILCLFKYIETKRKIFGIMFVVCGLCMFLTFSRAGYVSLFFSMGVYFYLRKKTKDKKASAVDLAGIVIRLTVAVITIYIVFYIVNIWVQNGNTENYLARQFTFSENGKVTLVREESSNLVEILKLLMVRPLGYGMTVLIHSGGIYDYNVANAISFWLYASGFIGALLILITMIWLIIKYAIPSMKSSQYMNRAFGIIFFSQFIFSFSYGTWLNPEFIYSIGMLLLSAEITGEKVEDTYNCSNVLFAYGSH